MTPCILHLFPFERLPADYGRERHDSGAGRDGAPTALLWVRFTSPMLRLLQIGSNYSNSRRTENKATRNLQFPRVHPYYLVVAGSGHSAAVPVARCDVEKPVGAEDNLTEPTEAAVQVSLQGRRLTVQRNLEQALAAKPAEEQ